MISAAKNQCTKRYGHFFAPLVGIEDAKCDLGRYDFPNPYRLKALLAHPSERFAVFRASLPALFLSAIVRVNSRA